MAVPTFGIYDPKQLVLNINGLRISGFAEGTFVNIKRTARRYSKVVGGDGSVFFTKSPDQSGELTFTLGISADSNQDVSDFIRDQDNTNAISTVDCHLLDPNGEIFELNEGLICFFDMDQTREYTLENPTREYSLVIGQLDQR